MSKKAPKESPKRSKRSFGAKLIWVANNLSEEKLNHVDLIVPTPEEVMEFFMAAVDNGIDIKVSYDTFSDCYQATAVGAWANAASAGYACSARSSRDAFDAIVLIWYKVAIMAEFDLSVLWTDKQEEDMRG